jgi:uncharacterized membrane protein HdeD (DUF308 family)
MIESIQKHRGLYIFESLIFIILGILAIALPGLFTYSMELLIGWLFLVGGIVQGYRTFTTGRTSSFIWSMASAIISIVVGFLLLAYPITGIITLTLFIAAFFFVEGIIQLFIGMQMRDIQGWGWMIFSGIISIILAGLIWSEFPGSARWVIGLLVGINLLIFGLSQLFLVISVKRN